MKVKSTTIKKNSERRSNITMTDPYSSIKYQISRYGKYSHTK